MRRRYYMLRGQHSKTGDDSQPLSRRNDMHHGGAAFELSEVSVVANPNTEEAGCREQSEIVDDTITPSAEVKTLRYPTVV